MSQIDFYRTHLDPLTFETLNRYSVSTGILVINMETFIRACTMKKADQAWNSYQLTDHYFQKLPVIHQRLAKDLFSAIWIKEKDAIK